ncbi:MAG: hypothetical protein AB7O91_04180 [Sphingomonas sp.]
MSRKTWPDTLDELVGFGADLKISCRSCGHEAVFNAPATIDYFRACHWPMAMEVVAARFRCSSCGSKRLRAGMKDRALPPPAPPKPRPRR